MSVENQRIAIIGISGVFPDADTVKQYWENLFSKKISISQLDKDKLYKEGYLDSALIKDVNYVPAKGLLNNATLFNAEKFGIPDKKARMLDPQFRLLLECASNVIEDASYNVKELNQSVGVYVSSSSKNNYYQENLIKNNEVIKNIDDYELLINNGKDFLATFIAYYLNLTGPSINIHTACSGSLVAVSQACDDLKLKKCNMAVAGGISITFPLNSGHLYKQGMIYSKDGCCKPFTNNASGIVTGNGGGLILLKRYDDAVNDGDNIYAVIKGYAVNNDGHNKLSYTAPSLNGQVEVIQAALKNANININQLGYIETHGTGTRLGDQIELAALNKVFSNVRERKNKCYLGAVKSNIGHLDVASGIAGLIKTIMQLNQNSIAENPYQNDIVEELLNNEYLCFTKALKQNIDYAGVSSFGVGGTNVHVILERYKGSKLAKIKSKYKQIGKNYCIEPSKKYITTEKQSDKFDVEKYLKKQTWIEKETNQNNKIRGPIILVEDKDRICDNIYNFFVNHYLDLELNIFKRTDYDVSEDLYDYVDKREQAWGDFLQEYKNHKEVSIIFFLDASEDSFEYKKINLFYDYYALIRAINSFDIKISIDIKTIVEKLVGDEVKQDISINQSLVYGPMLCLPIEYPFISTCCISVDKITLKLPEILEKELMNNDKEKIVRYSNLKRFVPTYESIHISNSNKSKVQFKHKGTYIITGGSGGIALTIAEYLSNHYSANLLLIVKNEFSGKKLTLIEKMKNKSDFIHVLKTDMSDKKQLLDTFKNIDVNLDHIDGVFHTASIFPEKLFHNKLIESIEAMFASKIYASNTLFDIFKDKPLDFMILFSSLNSYTGDSGATDYIAANSYLNAFAKSKSNEVAYPVISIAWDTWLETGMYYRTYLTKIKKHQIYLEKYESLLNEHKINDQIVVPGSMLLDIVISCMIDLESYSYPICLENITFARMLVVSSVSKSIYFYIDKNEISIKSEDQVILQANIKKPLIENLNDKTIKLNDLEKIDENLSTKRFINLGSHWNCLKKIEKLDDSYIAEIRLPDRFNNEEKVYNLHPATLDVGYSYHANFYENYYIPFFIKAMTIMKDLPLEFSSKIKIEYESMKKGICKANIEFYDNEKCFAFFEEFLLKNMKAKAG
jgi:3-oxoacyl-(acyl-carrier-protein) synthase/NADP-dependent 3-hydroxy acid dehydrogenase YdfG